jgi:hypothetical protein
MLSLPAKFQNGHVRAIARSVDAAGARAVVVSDPEDVFRERAINVVVVDIEPRRRWTPQCGVAELVELFRKSKPTGHITADTGTPML